MQKGTPSFPAGLGSMRRVDFTFFGTPVELGTEVSQSTGVRMLAQCANFKVRMLLRHIPTS